MSSEESTGGARPYFLFLVICGISLSALGYFQARAFSRNRAAGRAQVAQGQHSQARASLNAARNSLVSSFLDTAHELDYLTGLCDWRAGDNAAALANLRKVPAGSPVFGQARLALAEVELDSGRWRAAEDAIFELLDHVDRASAGKLEVKHDPESDPDVIEARKRLERYFRMQGRYRDAAAQQLFAPWHLSDPVPLLKSAWRDERGTPPYETIQEAIRIAETLSSGDSRVLLAKAIVATAEGQYDEADAALKSCEQPANRPDEAVLRARLEWMRATGKPFRLDSTPWIVRQNSPSFGLDDQLEWSEFLAMRAGDDALRARVLHTWRSLRPLSTAMLSRYAEFSEKSGDKENARESLRIKGEVERSIERYGQLMTGTAKPAGVQASIEWARVALSAGQLQHAGILAIFAGRSDPANEEARELVASIRQKLHEAVSSVDMIDSLWKSALAKTGEIRLAESSDSGETLIDPTFVDATEPAGLKFKYDNGETEIRQMPVALGGGVGMIDFDDDGDLDVYAVQGGPFPFDPKDPAEKPGDRLFRNHGGGLFEDCTESVGLPAKRVGYGLGVAVGDVNGDGFPDLFVTRFGAYGLYLNESGKRFRDVTEAWGLSGDRDWPSSAAFADFDNDGDLDLYVCHYVVWDAKNPRLCRNASTGKYMSCNPTTCDARPDHLFRNDGGKFVDVSESAGITTADTEGRGLGVIAADFDDDGLTDIFVANDKSANFLFRNLGGMKFEEIAQIAGVAAGSDGSYQAGMGVACGDYDNDGRLDIAVTNYYGESTTLYRNAGGMVFTDMTSATGLAAASRLRLGFGLAFADCDADGWLDLLSANGHTDNMGDVPYAMPAQLLMGSKKGRWRDATGEFPTSPLAVPRLGRGLAIGDLDDDGLVDALLLPQNESMVFLKNSSATKNRSISVRLSGTRSNRDGVGARLRLTTDRGVRISQRFGGGSYQSASEPFVRFGLPAGESVRSLEIRWPSGITDKIDAPLPERSVIVEGAGKAESSGSDRRSNAPAATRP
ncbi:hypothetical protein GC170_04460 [bacterium]|nr:hypothetical protein [bacterium]